MKKPKMLEILIIREKLDKKAMMFNLTEETSGMLDRCVEILGNDKNNRGVNRSVVVELLVRMLFDELNGKNEEKEKKIERK